MNKNQDSIIDSKYLLANQHQKNLLANQHQIKLPELCELSVEQCVAKRDTTIIYTIYLTKRRLAK